MTDEEMQKYFQSMVEKVFGNRMKNDCAFCVQIWSSITNVSWVYKKTKEEVSYSFREAGSLVSSIIGSGTYMDWYCSGPESTITREILDSFKKEGWIPLETDTFTIKEAN